MNNTRHEEKARLTPEEILAWIDRVGESYEENFDFIIIPENGIKKFKAQLAKVNRDKDICPKCRGCENNNQGLCSEIGHCFSPMFLSFKPKGTGKV